MTSIRELHGDVKVPGIGVFTRRQLELLNALSGTVHRVPPPGIKSGTVLSLQDRGFLRMGLAPRSYNMNYHDMNCELTQAGVEAVKGIRKVQRDRA